MQPEVLLRSAESSFGVCVYYGVLHSELRAKTLHLIACIAAKAQLTLVYGVA
jgi:hypothetical protein